MSTLPLIAIAVVIILLGIVFLINVRKEKRPTDYYNLFIIGVIWTAIGLPLKNYTLGILGLAFLSIGLVNKNKWKANHKTWNDLSARERKVSLGVMILIGVIVILGMITFLLIK
ncbi:MAG: hypothetical protein PHT51_03545 [Patescibacteria group bacterium]|nr:hypothetical protein [Patescibacteria group bacterium]MDD4610425.1 hypothetical protein [Patescibacteria group bacterium]